MRASRYIYIIGIAALTMMGCHRESHPSNPEMEAIGMAAPTVAGTRALFSDINPLAEFSVYGYKQGTSNEMVFTKQQVVKTGSTWDYSPKRYWDRVATYYFAAYAPSNVPTNINYAHNANNHTISVTLPHWQTIDGTETDIVVASSNGTATSYLDNGGDVLLTFDHLYAQFVVRVVRSASLQNTYKLTSIAYSNVPTVDGTATYTLDYTTPTNSKWDGVAISSDEWMNAYSNAGGEEITSNPEATPGVKHLVVPFTRTDNIEVKVNYTVNGAAQTGTADTGISQLEAGKRYVLTLSLGGGAIITPTLDIEQWIEIQDEKDIEINEDDKHNW